MKLKRSFFAVTTLIVGLGILSFFIFMVTNVAAEGGTEGAEFTSKSNEASEKGTGTDSLAPIASPVGGPSIFGTLDGSSPTWDRIFGGFVDLGCNSAVSDSGNNGQFYTTIPFQVGDSNPIEVTVNAGGTTINDTIIALYCDPFDPLSPAVNVVSYDDDGGSGLLSAFTITDTITLTPGNTYVLVLSTFSAGDMGDYQIDFSPNVLLFGPNITLNKTVGTDSSTCAATNDITVPYSTTVYYCYEVLNSGMVTMTSHDLVDSALGSILSGFPFTLTPSASTFLTVAATITQTTVNTATWTATDGITEAMSIDTATVNAPGWLEATPDSYDVVVALGYSSTLPLTLDNIGGEDVSYAITDVLGLPPIFYVGDVVGTFAYTFGGGFPVGLENNGNGDLLVTDLAGGGIYTMTVDGTQLPGGFTGTGNPIGVTTDGTLIYHTDTISTQVHSYLPDGTFVASFSVAAQTTFPEGITYNPNTGNLYVVNGSGENIVSEYQADGTHLTDYPVLGSSQDGIAYDPIRDSYWIYDSGTDTVRQYDTSFNVVSSFPGTINAGYAGGEGVAVIGDLLYVMATNSDTVVIFNLSEPLEAPWLHETPLTGTVPVQATDEVDVIFDATVVPGIGTYTATIVVENDGVGGTILIPVTMTVVSPVFDVVVAPDAALTDTVGTTVTYTLYVTNTGNAPDTFDLVATGNAWTTTLSDSSVNLGVGAGTMVWVTVEIPAGASDGDMDTITVMATSASDIGVSDSATLTTTAIIPITYIYLPFISRNG